MFFQGVDEGNTVLWVMALFFLYVYVAALITRVFIGQVTQPAIHDDEESSLFVIF